MKDFIDLEGVSGAKYRFRLWPEGAPHQPIAGNYACVREDAGGFTVLMVGETLDLSRVRHDLPKRLREGGVGVYTRLNVSRAIRTAEHEDIAPRYAGTQGRSRGRRAPPPPPEEG
jgi:hypothetical protein